MAIKYRLEPIQNNIAPEGRQGVMPVLVKGPTVTLQDVAAKINGDSSFTEGDVIGMVHQLAVTVAAFLEQGMNVNLGDLGTLGVTAKLREGKDPSEKVTGRDICIKRVVYRHSPYLRKRLANVTFEQE